MRSILITSLISTLGLTGCGQLQCEDDGALIDVPASLPVLPTEVRLSGAACPTNARSVTCVRGERVSSEDMSGKFFRCFQYTIGFQRAGECDFALWAESYTSGVFKKTLVYQIEFHIDESRSNGCKKLVIASFEVTDAAAPPDAGSTD